jgi:hypothetical protein
MHIPRSALVCQHSLSFVSSVKPKLMMHLFLNVELVEFGDPFWSTLWQGISEG